MNNKLLKKFGIETSTLIPIGFTFEKDNVSFNKTSSEVITINDVVRMILCISKQFKEERFFVIGQIVEMTESSFKFREEDLVLVFVGCSAKVTVHTRDRKIYVNSYLVDSFPGRSDNIFLFESSIDKYMHDSGNTIIEFEFSCADLI